MRDGRRRKESVWNDLRNLPDFGAGDGCACLRARAASSFWAGWTSRTIGGRTGIPPTLAITPSDALLGVCGGDREVVPRHRPGLKDADSLKLLAEVAGFVRERGFEIIDVDGVIAAQAWKLSLPRANAREPSGHGSACGKRRRKGHHHRALGPRGSRSWASPPTPPASCAAFNGHQNLTNEPSTTHRRRRPSRPARPLGERRRRGEPGVSVFAPSCRRASGKTLARPPRCRHD